MSGKRQHFIPRLLQKGFASHINDKGEVFTWVYRKKEKPFKSNIINVGVEGYFYSQDNNELDDKITLAESSKFNNLINSLHDNPDTAITNTELLAEMIGHFEIRTRHLRQSIIAHTITHNFPQCGIVRQFELTNQ